MIGSGILVANERLARLNVLAESAFGSRDFSLAEELYSEKLATLREFRYVEDLEVAKTLNMLAFSQECQSKFEQAAKYRQELKTICSENNLMTSPVKRPDVSPKQRIQPSLRQQMRVIKSA